MLPDRPATVNSVRAAVRPRMRRGQRKLWVALAVLAAHALLLGLFWNSQPARTPLPAPRPALIEISVLAPAMAAVAAARRPAGHNARPSPAAGMASHPAPAMATARTSPQPQPASASPDAAPTADAASPEMAPLAGDTASHPVQRSGTPADGAQKAGPGQASNAVPARIERPDSSADYLDNPRPAYPAMSRRLGEQGQVLLRVWVEADGRPSQVELRRSSGFDRLDRAALQAVQRWRFVPGQRAGLPEAMWTEVPLQFVLE